MYWNASTEFFRSRIVRLCLQPSIPHDTQGAYRVMILQRLFCAAVDGQRFKEPKDAAFTLNLPIRQLSNVWKLCIDENILRKSDGGYSTIEWLKEQKMYSDAWKAAPKENQTASVILAPQSRAFFE